MVTQSDDLYEIYCKDGPNTGYRIRPGPSKIKPRLNPNLTPESAWKDLEEEKKPNVES